MTRTLPGITMATDILQSNSVEDFPVVNLTFDPDNVPRPLSQSSFESVDMSVVHVPDGMFVCISSPNNSHTAHICSILYIHLELSSLNRAISLGVERTLFFVESGGLYFWRMRTRVPLARFEQTRRKDASPWQKQALNKLDVESRKLRALESLRGP